MAKADTPVGTMADTSDLGDWLCARIVEFMDDESMDADRLQTCMHEALEKAQALGGEAAKEAFEEQYGDPTKKLRRLFLALK